MLVLQSHSPQGECGLKLVKLVDSLVCSQSLPARGVWIEMDTAFVHLLTPDVTPRKGSVD